MTEAKTPCGCGLMVQPNICNQGRGCPLNEDTGDRSEEMMAWLLPSAMVVIAVLLLWACKHFGWLQ